MILFNNSKDSTRPITFPLTQCAIHEYKTGNDVSEFTHSNWITLSYYSSPNTRVWFLNIWYNPFTSVHSNLEHGLSVLTESFSPLRSVLHNLPCWSPKQKCATSHAIPFYITCIKPDQTGFHWLQLVPTNQSDWCKALTALLEIPTTSQLTIDVDEMLWHAWSQKSHCYVVKFRFTSLYDKMAAARVLSDNMSWLHKVKGENPWFCLCWKNVLYA